MVRHLPRIILFSLFASAALTCAATLVISRFYIILFASSVESSDSRRSSEAILAQWRITVRLLFAIDFFLSLDPKIAQNPEHVVHSDE